MARSKISPTASPRFFSRAQFFMGVAMPGNGILGAVRMWLIVMLIVVVAAIVGHWLFS